MNYKMTLLAGAIGSVLSGAALADINNIIISEYAEGSYGSYATNSAIEILNTGDTDYTFNDDYALYYSSFGNKVLLPDDSTPVLRGVTVPAKGAIVVINSDARDDLKAAITANGKTPVVAGSYGEIGFAALNFNGGEAVWIAAGDDKNAIHDIVGLNTSGWGENITYRRSVEAQTPSATHVPENWVGFDVDTFDGLGDPTLAEPPAEALPCTDAQGLLTKTIGAVQGTGYSSPLIEEGKYESEDEYLVRGTVTAIGTSLTKGFYLYDENADGEVRSSDGIFVKTSAEVSPTMIGQQICVRAKVKEDYGMTTLIPTDNIWEVENATPVTAVPVDLVRIDSDDETFRSTLERLEGMPVRLVKDMDATADGEQNMRVSRTFSFDYDAFRNNMVIAYQRPNPQPNQVEVAGSDEALALSRQNRDYRVYVESDQKAGDGDIPYYPDFATDPANNYIRINDTVTGLEGILHYSYNEFRLIPTNQVDSSSFTHNTKRTSTPSISEVNSDFSSADSFAIRVATKNVLNYFNSPFGGTDNPFGDNRGAESDIDFERQQTKIVEAIYDIDADILGLMEIENNGFGDRGALKELLAAINAKYDDEDYGDRNKKNSIHNRYVFVGFDKNGDTILDHLDTVGSDAITNALIYRPSKVSIVGGKVISLPQQRAPMIVDENGAPILDSKGEIRESGNNYHRQSVAATFKVLNTGKNLTVAVNHFKSKGTTCYEDWLGWEEWSGFDPVRDDLPDADFQGQCEHFRVAAAHQLGTELAKMGGDRVIIGDLNSYANEDAMLVLTDNPTAKPIKAAGYTFVDDRVQFGPSGANITQSFGYVNAVSSKAEDGQMAWSYSYNDEIGSLDHLLISGSLEHRLVDAMDWHINAAESSLYSYSSKYKGGDDNEPNPFYAADPYRSSDHDPAIMTLGYKYTETDGGKVTFAVKSGRADIPFPVSELAKKGDVASLSIDPYPADGVVLPVVPLTKDGAQTIMFDAASLPTGQYKLGMKLVRPAAEQARSGEEVIESKSMEVNFIKRDSSTVTPVLPQRDGSGGSWGIAGLMMLGLAALRRRKG